jgi:hypothetical protein
MLDRHGSNESAFAVHLWCVSGANCVLPTVTDGLVTLTGTPGAAAASVAQSKLNTSAELIFPESECTKCETALSISTLHVVCVVAPIRQRPSPSGKSPRFKASDAVPFPM